MISLENIPKEYVYCFADKKTCPKVDTCLRAIAVQLLAASGMPQPTDLRTVNALYVRQLPSPAACPLYRHNEPERYARGMTHLFDEIPLKHAPSIRKRVIRCFTSETLFFRSRKGERLISPEEQRAILKVFQSMGLDITPVYDEFTYAPSW